MFIPVSKESYSTLTKYHRKPEAVAANWTAARAGKDSPKTLDMSWPHPPQGRIKHCKTAPLLESKGEGGEAC